MHHKRKRPKNRRAGCLWCKPHKANGADRRTLAEVSAEKFIHDGARLHKVADKGRKRFGIEMMLRNESRTYIWRRWRTWRIRSWYHKKRDREQALKVLKRKDPIFVYRCIER